jgi:type IV pilus assembly protein PilC
MPTFTATYKTKTGQQREIKLEAENPAAARRVLRRRGVTYTTLSRSRSPIPVEAKQRNPEGLKHWLEKPVTISDKAIFANKLATMVNAGVPILRGLDMIQKQQKPPLFRRALKSMVQEVNQGESLANSMRKWPKVFDNLTVAMVEAGEAGGVLDETLHRLALLLEQNSKLQNQIKGALGYPITVLVVAILVFLGMTIFLIPSFASTFETLNAELPAFTIFMVSLSEFLRSPGALVLVAALILAFILLARFYQTPFGRRQIDRLVLKLPLFGDLIQKTVTAQFCRTLASLSKAGVPILMALDLLFETTSNSVMSDAIKASRQDVSEGVPLSTALGSKNLFPELAISMLGVGEETGNMDAMLSKVADFYEDEISTAVKLLTSLIEPAMIILVGGIVAAILLAMYLPMFSVFEKIR